MSCAATPPNNRLRHHNQNQWQNQIQNHNLVWVYGHVVSELHLAWQRTATKEHICLQNNRITEHFTFGHPFLSQTTFIFRNFVSHGSRMRTGTFKKCTKNCPRLACGSRPSYGGMNIRPLPLHRHATGSIHSLSAICTGLRPVRGRFFLSSSLP